ncbi:MAG: hypothetical protein RIR51_198 [Bacteroidota bacterium]
MVTTTSKIFQFSFAKFFALFFILFTAYFTANAQVKIGDNPSTIHPSAAFEIESTNQGLLLPRVPDTLRTTIPDPATGLIIFNTTDSKPYNFNGTSWKEISSLDTNLINTKAGSQALLDSASAIRTTLNTKAGSQALLDSASAIRTTLNTKAGSQALIDSTSSIRTTLNTKAGSQALLDSASAIRNFANLKLFKSDTSSLSDRINGKVDTLNASIRNLFLLNTPESSTDATKMLVRDGNTGKIKEQNLPSLGGDLTAINTSINNLNSTTWKIGGNSGISGNGTIGTASGTFATLSLMANGFVNAVFNSGTSSFSIGRNAVASSATYNNTIAIGSNSNASANGNTIAIGNGAVSGGASAISIGQSSNAYQNYGTAVGYLAKAGVSGSTGISATALGHTATATGNNSTALGNAANASNASSTAVGQSAQGTGLYSTALGFGANASNESAIAIGNSAQASALYSISMGLSSVASTQGSIAIGTSANASSSNRAIAIGYYASATGERATAVGGGSQSGASSSPPYPAIASGQFSAAFGTGSEATGASSVAIGNGATASQANAIVLGGSSHSVGIRTGSPSSALHVAGDLQLSGSGSKLKVETGQNYSSAGTFTLDGSGTATVNTSAVTANSIIMLTAQDGAIGSLTISSRVAGSSFTVTSSAGATDTGKLIGFFIIN